MSALNSQTSPEHLDQAVYSGSRFIASLRSHVGLWIMTLSGALLIFSFGFGSNWTWMKQLDIQILGTQLTATESWELGAITWSLMFGVYYYFTFPSAPKDRINRVVAALLSLGTVVLCGLAAYSLHTNNIPFHFRYVAAIGFLFCLTDFILFLCHTGARRKMFLESLWVADAPMIAGLVTLLFFQIYHKDQRQEMQTFLAGAISFQLIVSNVVFILCQFGVLRRIWSEPGNEPVFD